MKGDLQACKSPFSVFQSFYINLTEEKKIKLVFPILLPCPFEIEANKARLSNDKRKAIRYGN